MEITKELLEKYHLGRCTLEEEKAVESWLANDIVETDFPSEMGDGVQRENHIWESISDNLGLEETEEIETQQRGLVYMLPRVAAAVVFLVGIGSSVWFFSKNNTDKISKVTSVETKYVTVRTAKGEKKEFVLPDGTRINLNGDSELRHFERITSKDTLRLVYLNGEAFFNVIKDPQKPFVVKTSGSKTRVLGTRFSIRTYADEATIQLVVEEGKVRFSSEKTGKSVLLTANERALLLESGRIKKDPVYAPKFLAWKNNKLIFENQPMLRIAKELERWFGVEVSIQNAEFQDHYYTGSFQDKSLGEVLETMRYAVGFKYTVTAKKVVIY